MDEIPAQLLAKLSDSAAASARSWWTRLTDEDRADVLALCIPDGEPPEAPRVIGGRFLADDEAAGWEEWRLALFDQLISDPDPAFFEPPSFRRFFIGGFA